MVYKSVVQGRGETDHECFICRMVVHLKKECQSESAGEGDMRLEGARRRGKESGIQDRGVAKTEGEPPLSARGENRPRESGSAVARSRR